MATTILVVDDDARVRKLLRNVLEGDGFVVVEAHDRSSALACLRLQDTGLITLDIQLGADDGFELLREIRTQSQVPIVMVTGRTDVIDSIVGLEIGADDYITKPFHVREILARVRSVLRRAAAPPVQPDIQSDVFRFDGLTAVPERFELLSRVGSQIDLTSGEFRLLDVFLKRPKRVLSRDQLMDLIGGHDWSPTDRTIDNQVARLRKKIERDPARPKMIKSVRGIGYTFACDVLRETQTG